MRTASLMAGLLLAFAAGDAAADWVTCAPEGGNCAFQGRREVAFGSGNRWFTRSHSDGVKCSSTSFGGDPAPGVVKSCKVNVVAAAPSPQWSNCAREGETCALGARREVSFGSGNKWITTIFASSVKCTTDSFQGDPAPGVVKTCRVRDIAGGSSPRWVKCAGEGQVCKFSGDRNVAYGADIRIQYRVFRNGVTCSSKNFGDPAPGAAKSCSYDAN